MSSQRRSSDQHARALESTPIASFGLTGVVQGRRLSSARILTGTCPGATRTRHPTEDVIGKETYEPSVNAHPLNGEEQNLTSDVSWDAIPL